MKPPSTAEIAERRFIFNGDTQPPPVFDNIQRGNRPVRKRKRSPFTIVVILFALSIVSVLYIWNKIMVNKLLDDVTVLESEYQKVLSETEILQREVNAKSNTERIEKIAGERLGMQTPHEPPIWFSYDDGPLARLEEK